MSAVPRISLTIDGRPAEVPKGTTILEAAQQAGIKIPHFCYHRGIGIDGNCRICLVEVKGASKLVISCATEAVNGAEVFTRSPRVVAARRAVLEFILLNHPLDCPFCDKGGECPLQNYTYDYRLGHSRFTFPKQKGVKHQVIGEHIIFDSERCILCSRCTRFLKNLVGRPELYIEERGSECRIRLFEGKQLSGDFSGNLADFCPVGALTSRDFRFRARPWEMRTTPSSCGACPMQCSIQHWTRAEKYLRTTPRIDPALNGYWLCDRGRYAHQRWLTAGRLLRPQRGGAKGWEAVSFAAAYAELARLAAKAGRIYLYPSAGLSNEELAVLYLIAQRSPKARVVLPEGLALLTRRYGEIKSRDLLPGSLRDFLASPQLLLLGEDPFRDHPVLALLLRKYRFDNRGKIWLCGETPGELASLAATQKISAVALNLEQLLREIPQGQPLSVLLHRRFAEERIFSELVAAVERRQFQTYVVLGYEGPNLAGWMELEKQFPGCSVDLPTAQADAAALHYRWCSQGEETPAGAAGTTVWESHTLPASDRADLVFPWESPLEKTGSYVNFLGQPRKLNRGVGAVEATHYGYRHLLQVAAALGVPLDFRGVEELYAFTLGKADGMPADYSAIPDETTLYGHYQSADHKHQTAQAKAADTF